MQRENKCKCELSSLGLTTRTLAYIDRNADTLLKSKTFLQIDQKLLCEILNRDQLIVSEEIAIWNAALRWADEQCDQNGKECSGENRRLMLGMALYKIRFPIIRNDCLAKVVSSGVLTSAELVSVLLYHSSAALSELYPLPFPIHRRSTKSTGKLTLKLTEFARKKADRSTQVMYSDAVYIGGFQWKIMAEITIAAATKLAIYVKCDAKDYGSKWSCSCSVTMRIVSPKKEKADLVREFEHTFAQQSGGWGWPHFTTFEELMSPYNGWYNEEKDTVTLSADLTIKLNDDETK
ncbi:hypothetical protein niasHS_008778 [Heterodera schachtii]|uniref:MATH domain-containing protein n=1 Tax=Heterodera schachtii TaxID=97005 RepID=A0ABD2J7K0_HETSC